MTSTDLANRSLSRIGLTAISSIDDGNSKAAKTCKQLLPIVIDEVLRSHRWNCASARTTLSQSVTAPPFGYTQAFILPADFIRLMEVNGEQYEGSEEFLEIEEDKRLLVNSTRFTGGCHIRYIRRIDVPKMDPLLLEAVACKLSAEIAIPLSAKIELQTHSMTLYERALGNARKVDAMETGSKGQNRPLERLLQNSPLLQARYQGRYELGQFINKWPQWQIPQNP